MSLDASFRRASLKYQPGVVNWEIHAKELMMFMMLMAQALRNSILAVRAKYKDAYHP